MFTRMLLWSSILMILTSQTQAGRSQSGVTTLLHRYLLSIPKSEPHHICLTGNNAHFLMELMVLRDGHNLTEFKMESNLQPENKCTAHDYSVGNTLFLVVENLEDRCAARWKAHSSSCDVLVHAHNGPDCDQLWKFRMISNQCEAPLVVLHDTPDLLTCYEKKATDATMNYLNPLEGRCSEIQRPLLLQKDADPSKIVRALTSALQETSELVRTRYADHIGEQVENHKDGHKHGLRQLLYKHKSGNGQDLMLELMKHSQNLHHDEGAVKVANHLSAKKSPKKKKSSSLTQTSPKRAKGSSGLTEGGDEVDADEGDQTQTGGSSEEDGNQTDSGGNSEENAGDLVVQEEDKSGEGNTEDTTGGTGGLNPVPPNTESGDRSPLTENRNLTNPSNSSNSEQEDEVQQDGGDESNDESNDSGDGGDQETVTGGNEDQEDDDEPEPVTNTGTGANVIIMDTGSGYVKLGVAAKLKNLEGQEDAKYETGYGAEPLVVVRNVVGRPKYPMIFGGNDWEGVEPDSNPKYAGMSKSQFNPYREQDTDHQETQQPKGYVLGLYKGPDDAPGDQRQYVQGDGHFQFDDGIRGVMEIIKPMKYGIVLDIENQQRVWDHGLIELCKKMQRGFTFSEDYIITTEAPLNPIRAREEMVNWLFNTKQFMGVYVGSQAIMAMIGYGDAGNGRSGIVVDIGDGTTHIVPIFEGYALPHAIKRIDIGGQDVTAFLGRILTEREDNRGRRFVSTAEQEVLRKIKEKMAKVAENDSAWLALTKAPYDEAGCYGDNEVEEGPCRDGEGHMLGHKLNNLEKYVLPDGATVEVADQKWRMYEPLFDPMLIGMETPGVHSHIHQCIKECDMDIRPKMYGKVFLSGGTCSAHGFGKRLQWELTQIIEKEFRGLADAIIVDPTNKPTVTVYVPGQPKTIRDAVYNGAFVLPSLVGFQELFMKNENDPSPHHIWHFADVRPNRHLLHNDKFRLWKTRSDQMKMGIQEFHNNAQQFQDKYLASKEVYDKGDRPGQWWPKDDEDGEDGEDGGGEEGDQEGQDESEATENSALLSLNNDLDNSANDGLSSETKDTAGTNELSGDSKSVDGGDQDSDGSSATNKLSAEADDGAGTIELSGTNRSEDGGDQTKDNMAAFEGLKAEEEAFEQRKAHMMSLKQAQMIAKDSTQDAI